MPFLVRTFFLAPSFLNHVKMGSHFLYCFTISDQWKCHYNGIFPFNESLLSFWYIGVKPSFSVRKKQIFKMKSQFSGLQLVVSY